MQTTRRNLLNIGLATAGAALVPAALQIERLPVGAPKARSLRPLAPTPPLASVSREPARRAFVHNLHTGDKLDAVYYENGRYVPDALAAAMRVLRDWRNGEEHVMDPRLFDVLHTVSAKVEARAPFQIISGYRSPESNAMMHARSAGVASHSQHMLGKALDIRLEGVELHHLHAAALSVGAGGVGLYPVSNFVHVDVGPVRKWTGV